MQINMKLKICINAFLFMSTVSTCMMKSQGESSDCSCGVENNLPMRPVIINGNVVTPPYRYPWMVHIFTENKGKISPQCGGFLISQQFLLTAAHCFPPSFNIDEGRCYDENGIVLQKGNCTKVTVRFLTHDYTTSDHRLVREVIQHPDYSNETSKADIAIVRLWEPAECDTYTRPICLRTDTRPWDIDGKYAVVAGWGASDNTTEENEGLSLKEAVVQIQDKETCNEDKIICGIGDNQGPCGGDSGGPLFIKDENGKYYAIGIVSTGIRNCDQNLNVVPSSYTEIQSYMNWIGQNVALENK